MIKINKIKVSGIEEAIYGMRHPLESYNKIDTVNENGIIKIGPNDLNLMKRLYKAGTDHRKYLRQILIHIDITAPLYWWKQFDQYKISVTTNSTSTMHKIMAKPFDYTMFSFDFDTRTKEETKEQKELLFELNKQEIEKTIKDCNRLRDLYLNEDSLLYKNKNIWRLLIQKLPSSYNQTRMVTMSYENFINMYHSRKNHKLEEWPNFLKITLSKLPGLKEIAEL